jgi:hypothetical protein
MELLIEVYWTFNGAVHGTFNGAVHGTLTMIEM